jgi:hypothetical protein
MNDEAGRFSRARLYFQEVSEAPIDEFSVEPYSHLVVVHIRAQTQDVRAGRRYG